MEKLFKYVYPRTPYRCKECWSRFWIFENPFKTILSKVIAGFAACILIFMLSWPFLPFNKKPPVKVDKKENSGSLFLTSRSETQKPEVTKNNSQKKEDPIASFEDPQPAPIENPLIRQEDNTEPLLENNPEITISSLNTDPLEKKTGTGLENKANTELETKSQSVKAELIEKETAESASSKKSVDTSVPGKKHKIKENYIPVSVKKAGPKTNLKIGQNAERNLNKNIEPILQFKGIKISESESSFDILLKTDKMTEKHEYFFITNPAPPRIVIDLPGKWNHKGDPVFKTNSDIISQVRVGKHPDFFRIVLDMKTKKRLFPSFKETPEGLLVSVKQ